MAVSSKDIEARPAATGVPPSPEAPADRGNVSVSYVTVGLSNGIREEF